MQKIFIIEACRTAIGSFNGTLSQIFPQDYTTELIKHILNKFPNLKDKINKVIMGHVLQAGCGMNTARQAAIKAGLTNLTTAYVVNMVCGSGLKSTALGCLELQNVVNEFVLVGGHENMSMAPHLLHNRSDKNVKKLGEITITDSILSEGLTDVFNNYHMGITAENLAKKYNVSRKEQDEYSLLSQQKASLADKKGLFQDEIVGILIKHKKGEEMFSKDEFIKHDTDLEKLSKLKSAFAKDADGTVTAGNSSGINDGAAVLLLATESTVKKYNMKALAEIVSFEETGVDPAIMGIGPVESSKKALKSAGWQINDIDLFEMNEAFAAQSLAVLRELKPDITKVNIKGGAIALGHPIGASGARCLVTLVHSLKQKNLEKGLVSLCIGGGMGVAMCVRNLN